MIGLAFSEPLNSRIKSLAVDDAASLELRHRGRLTTRPFHDFHFKTGSINLKKIGIDIDP